jgi:hypothetical protein
VAERLTEAQFSPYLGEMFRLVLDPGSVLELELVEVAAIGAGQASEHGRSDPFSIVFRGPAEPVLAQGTYRVEHDRMGSFDLFLVPVAPDSDHHCYQAVFA